MCDVVLGVGRRKDFAKRKPAGGDGRTAEVRPVTQRQIGRYLTTLKLIVQFRASARAEDEAQQRANDDE